MRPFIPMMWFVTGACFIVAGAVFSCLFCILLISYYAFAGSAVQLGSLLIVSKTRAS